MFSNMLKKKSSSTTTSTDDQRAHSQKAKKKKKSSSSKDTQAISNGSSASNVKKKKSKIKRTKTDDPMLALKHKKQSKANKDQTATSSKPKHKKKASEPSKIDTLKKQLLAANANENGNQAKKVRVVIKKKKKKTKQKNLKSTSSDKENMAYNENTNMLPNSAKKAMKSSPAKKKKSDSASKQVQSMKKVNSSSNAMDLNAYKMAAPHNRMSAMYGYSGSGAAKRKKKKSSAVVAVAGVSGFDGVGKKQKKHKASSQDPKRNENLRKKKKKKTGADSVVRDDAKHVKKKKAEKPASTEKLCLVRKKVKTKTKKKELYVIGDYVRINADKWGCIRYKGYLKNVTGIWYGIELCGTDKNGECDGEFNDERYFECESNAGLFVMYEAIECRMKSKEVLAAMQKMENESRSKKKEREKRERKKKKNMAQSLSAVLSKQMMSSSTTAANSGKPHKKKQDENVNKKKKVKKKKKVSGKKPAKISLKNTLSSPPTLTLDTQQTNERRFKWDIPSKSKQTHQPVELDEDDDDDDDVEQDQMNSNDAPFIDLIGSPISPHSPSLTSPSPQPSTTGFAKFAAATPKENEQSMAARQTPKVYSASNNNLTYTAHRGRKPSKSKLSTSTSTSTSTSSASDREDSTHRRAHSLSNTRDDASWMKHSSEENKRDRIAENRRQQKQIDLESLMSAKRKKKEISALFQKHIEKAKSYGGSAHSQSASTSAGGGGPAADTVSVSAVALKEKLKNEEEALQNAVSIVKDLGFFKYIKDNEIYSKIYIKQKHRRKLHAYGRTNNEDEKDEEDDFDLFDMNNIDILSKFHGKTRQILARVLCTAIVSAPSVEIVEICNCDIDADFMEILVDYLCEYYANNGQDASISILSMQSNPIDDRGMMALCKLLTLNHRSLNTVKLQNNRKDISTMVCQQICEALQQNEYIVRFEFEFRHYQWRDFRDKVLKRNAEKARAMRRLQMTKTISV